MTGVACSRVEATAVVADLDEHAPRSSLDANPRRARAGVLHDVGERLAPDAEQLGLGAAREREAAVGPLHVDRQPIPVVEPRGVLGEGGDEPVLDGVAAQLEDERAHLALRAPRQLSDRGQGSPERAGRAHALLLDRLLGGAGVQSRREQRLGDGVVQIACDPVPLLDGLLALVPLRLGQLRGGPLALADDGAQEERRERRDGDVDLRAQGPVVDRLLEERPDVVGGDSDRHPGRDRDRQRGARRPESESRPDQRRKDHVGHRLVGRDRDHAEHGDRGDQERALPACGCAAMPRRDRGAHTSISGRTTSPPEVSPSHHVRQNFGRLGRVDDPAGQHRHRPHRRADRRGGPERHEHAADLLDSIQGRARADQPAQQQRPDDDLGHVAGLLADQASERQRVVVEEQALR